MHLDLHLTEGTELHAHSRVDDTGRPLVVVCSVGIDLDLVPTAADIRSAHDPDARLVLAVPERDDHPVTRALAQLLREPADIIPIAGDWRAI